MKTVMAWMLGLALGLAACGGDPMKACNAALAAKDAVKAEALLSSLLQAKPELKMAHMQHFVVLRYLASQGDPARQSAYQDQAMADYDWMVKAYGLTADYRDMDSSLKANAPAAADLAAARKPLYGD